MQASRARCAAATGPLQDAVRSLCQFADSPEFASIPAKISAQARQNQEAILDCGRWDIYPKPNVNANLYTKH